MKRFLVLAIVALVMISCKPAPPPAYMFDISQIVKAKVSNSPEMTVTRQCRNGVGDIGYICGYFDDTKKYEEVFFLEKDLVAAK